MAEVSSYDANFHGQTFGAVTTSNDRSILTDGPSKLPDSATQTTRLPQKKARNKRIPFTHTNLGKLPRELRNHIYGYLLIDPELSNLAVTAPINTSTSPDEYSFDVHVQLLYVCQQLYTEASEFLYSRNTFSFKADLEKIIYHKRFDIARPENHQDRLIISSTRVRNWKLLITHQHLSPETLNLLQFLAYKPPNSLELVLCPQNRIWNSPQVKLFLLPLYKLRNINNIIIRGAKLNEFHNKFYTPSLGISWTLYSLYESNRKALGDLEELIRGDSPVGTELLYPMNQSLITYAQSFERFQGFKHQMVSFFDLPGFAVSHKSCSSCLRRNKTFPELYAEDRLSTACKEIASSIAMDSGTGFKHFRSVVVEWLEPQYLRIVGAATQLKNFFSRRKSNNFFLIGESVFYHPEEYDLYLASFLVLLKDFDTALKTRDMHLEDKARVHLHQEAFDALYRNRGFDNAMSFLTVDNAKNNYPKFQRIYKSVLKRLRSQFQAILAARSLLFQYDTANDLRCDIGANVSPYLDYEGIVWSLSVQEEVTGRALYSLRIPFEDEYHMALMKKRYPLWDGGLGCCRP